MKHAIMFVSWGIKLKYILNRRKLRINVIISDKNL
jgi:hypothetical protein